jgi:hypothetical protein
MTIGIETARHIAQTLQTSPFTERRQRPLDEAQDNLGGRTYYAETRTLRFHKARILSARPVSCGAFFLIIESCALDYQNTRRGFRAVLFDLTGGIVYRPNLEGCRRTREQASADFYKWFGTFDGLGHYRAEMNRRADTYARQIVDLQDAAAVLAALQDEGVTA